LRIKVDLVRISKCNEISINYGYKLYAALINTISRSSEEVAKNLHNTKKYKHFTFSLLQIPKREIIGDRIRILGRKAYFYASSPNDDLIEELIKGLLIEQQIMLDRLLLAVKKIRLYNPIEFEEKPYTFSTLSPIILRTLNDSKETRYLYIVDYEFPEKIRENLIRRYTAFYGHPPENDKFDITDVILFKPVKYIIKDIHHRGSRAIFQVEGSPELLKFAYESGLGEKTAMGFGMVKIKSN